MGAKGSGDHGGGHAVTGRHDGNGSSELTLPAGRFQGMARARASVPGEPATDRVLVRQLRTVERLVSDDLGAEVCVVPNTWGGHDYSGARWDPSKPIVRTAIEGKTVRVLVLDRMWRLMAEARFDRIGADLVAASVRSLLRVEGRHVG